MIRIVVSPDQVSDTRISLNKDQWHYLFRVMRAVQGQSIEALVAGQALYGTRVTKDGLVVTDRWPVPEAVHPHVMLVQSLLKQDRFAEVVEKGTEAGVRIFVPLVADRSIVREAPPQKLNRWRTIAREAAEQSRRGDVPAVQEAVRVAQLELPRESLGIVFDPGGIPIGQWHRTHPKVDSVCLVVGPEGGLTGQEVEDLTGKGFDRVSLGPRIYRSENAGVFAALLLVTMSGYFESANH